jgi:LPXTG-motif cell wall-anchored protein
MLDWINENFWTFMGIMIVLLLALIGLFLFLRNKRPED